MTCELKPVHDSADWASWHAIRERVLWEARGEFGVYDRNHPSLQSPGHFPFLLLRGADPIGAIAVEIVGSQAWLRRVAIREDAQGRGHGRTMVQLALAFAGRKRCTGASSNVHPDAVGFYEKLGFRVTKENPEHGPRMSIEL